MRRYVFGFHMIFLKFYFSAKVCQKGFRHFYTILVTGQVVYYLVF